MAAKKPKSDDTKIYATILALIAKNGWDGFNLPSLAKSTKIPPAKIHARFSNEMDALPFLIEHIESCIARDIKQSSTNDTLHDSVFDVLMRWFDELQKGRAGHLALTQSVREAPCLLRHLLPAQIKALKNLLGKATKQKIPAALLLALPLLYGLIHNKWSRDNSPDLAATMAYTDFLLRRFWQLSNLVN